MEIKKADMKDYEEIFKLQKTSFISEAEIHNDYNIEPLTQNFEEFKEECGKSTVLKAVENGTIVGSVRGITENNILHISKLMVHPDFRRRGIGKSLINEIESMFIGFSNELFTSSKSADNLSLYSKLGYNQFKTKKLPGGITLIFLKKINMEKT